MDSTVSYTPVFACEWQNDTKTRGKTLEQQQLNQFLGQIERRAYKMALIATRQREDALDIVQDAMIKLAQSYTHKPHNEWQPLFYRILHNRIMDWHRRKKLENLILKWLPGKKDQDSDASISDYADENNNPEEINKGRGTIQQLELELHQLPPRQRQAFLLRSWEGLSVAETAGVMGCSEGSVKTHYSRALTKLKENLGEHWP